MYMSVEDAGEPRTIAVPFAAGLALVLSLAVTLGVGIFPGVLSRVAKDATPVLVLEPADPAPTALDPALDPDAPTP